MKHVFESAFLNVHVLGTRFQGLKEFRSNTNPLKLDRQDLPPGLDGASISSDRHVAASCDSFGSCWEIALALRSI